MKYEILPKEYWEKHDYLLYAYDVLGDMLRQADQKKLSQATIKFNDVKEAESLEDAEDILKWLDHNNYHDESVHLFNSHVYFSLLRDFCYFMYESMSCSERGKVSVSYALLRKPIRDNLFYLEWLLCNGEELYKALLYGSLEDYDIDNNKTFPYKRKKNIIKTASMQSHLGRIFSKDDFIYSLRYDSSNQISLQRIWNKAMHLVTSRSPHYKTEEGNINFLFANEKIWDDYWNYYYWVCPHLMAYVLEICEALFLKIIDIDEINLALNRGIRILKYCKLYPDIAAYKPVIDSKNDLLNIIQSNNVAICYKCDSCGSNIYLKADQIDQMINSWYLTCKYCLCQINICRYYANFIIMDNNK